MSWHGEWLALVERDGLLLSEPVLESAYPKGFPTLEPEAQERFKQQYGRYQLARKNKDAAGVRAWLGYSLQELLGYGSHDYLKHSLPDWAKTYLYEFGQELRPDWVLLDPAASQRGALLVMLAESSQDLDRRSQAAGQWRASPSTRLERLLRETGHPLGLVTNGEAYRLVYAPAGLPAGKLTFRAQTLYENRVALRAFVMLLGKRSVLAGEGSKRLLALAEESQTRQVDVADQLGEQVKEALTVLLGALDQSDRDADGALLAKTDLADLYEMHLVVMMRLLFQLYAEERALLPHGELFFDQGYGLSDLWQRLTEQERNNPASLNHTHDAWARLLASWRLIFHGSTHPDMNLIAYGGRLFDPARYPLLEDERLRVPNRAVLGILRKLLFARASRGGVSQRVSYQELDVEQIGYLYEGLLDHKIKRADEPTLILERDDAEVSLNALEAQPEPKRANFIAGRSRGYKESDVAKRLERVTPLEPHPPEWDALPEGLIARAKPYHPLVREVIPEGRLYLGQGESRRATGTHYTPVHLTERIVRVTLEPLCYHYGDPKDDSTRRVKSARELLALKVCDPAMGSGAFLVQVVRYLSERLVEAWELEIAKQPSTPLALPYAEPSRDPERDQLIPADHEEARLMARRFVAERCVYGVDKNPLAVEMAKLSLWLATLAKDKPFSFLDHALKHGDSLVGVTLEQIKRFSLMRDEIVTSYWTNETQNILQEVMSKRQELEAMPVISPEDYASKERQLEQIQADLAFVRTVGDALIGCFFADNGMSVGYNENDVGRLVRAASQDPSQREQLRERAARMLNGQTPFHWPLEYPEVFLRENGGFDAFVGNPPFQSGKSGDKSISAVFGERYVSFLESQYVADKRTADLCSYFFNKAFSLMSLSGAMGVIATNSISEGASRDVGLEPIVNNGGEIYCAEGDLVWPGKAAVVISLVWVTKRAWDREKLLNGRYVSHISSRLEPVQDIGEPFTLIEAVSAYQGTKPRGDFTLPIGEADALGLEDAKHLPKYLAGEDIKKSSTVSASRKIIYFPESTEDEARQANPELFDLLKKKVLNYRQRLGGRLRDRWWQFEYAAEEIYEAVASRGLGHIYALCRVSNIVALARVPSDQIFADGVVVFLFDKPQLFGVLQSTLYSAWVRKYCATYKLDIRFNPSDVVANFPLPQESSS